MHQKKISPVLLACLIPIVVTLFGVAIVLTRRGGKFGGTPSFPLQAYLSAPETLRGNAYVIRGQIEGRLGFLEGKGAIIAVKLLEASEGKVPVFVPESASRDIEVGQRYNIRVLLRRDLAMVEAMEKI